MFQHDPIRVDVLVKDLGLEQGNSVQTPVTEDVTEEEQELLDQVQHSKYRLPVARCLFLSRYRADITLIVNKLGQRMSNATKPCEVEEAGQIFESRGTVGANIQLWKNDPRSDDSGRLHRTRKSSNAGVTLRQPHTESKLAQAKDHCKKQRGSIGCSIGSVWVDRNCVVVEGSELRDEASAGH